MKRRKYRAPKPFSEAEYRRRYSFVEAKQIRGPFVYGLEDGTGVFYVGKTIDASSRFNRYVRPNKLPLNLLRRIRDANGEVLVRVLLHNPPDLDAAEQDFIAALAPEIMNHTGSARHILAQLTKPVADRMLASHLARCPKCDNQNFKDGRHLCSNTRLEILNPPATGKVQQIMVDIGIMREGYEVPRERPNIYK